MADQLETLKAKYQSVLDLISQKGVHLQHVHIQDNKLFIQGAAPSEEIKNDVWNQIKHVDGTYSDLTAEISVDSSLPQPAAAASATSHRTYTIQPGDTLSGISQRFYGKASEYSKILEANKETIPDADKIRAGQTIVIP